MSDYIKLHNLVTKLEQRVTELEHNLNGVKFFPDRPYVEPQKEPVSEDVNAKVIDKLYAVINYIFEMKA